VWLSELSERSGVPIATIKYYLREGLLPGGDATGARRARYTDDHVARLRLIRALVEVAGMSLERVRGVLAAVDDEASGLDVAIGSVHGQLSAWPTTEPSADARGRVAALVRALRWRVDPEGRHGQALAAALDAMAAAGQPMTEANLAVYAHAAADVARADVAALQGLSRAGATTYAVIGTILAEPVLLSLRRMAQENLARRGRR
jgi:DNA-binding transcriptional MerR regulator